MKLRKQRKKFAWSNDCLVLWPTWKIKPLSGMKWVGAELVRRKK